MAKRLFYTLILSIFGAAINVLPAPFVTDALFAYGFFVPTFVALLFGWQCALLSSCLVSIPIIGGGHDLSIVLLIMQAFLIGLTCFKQSSSRLVSITLMFWLFVALPAYLMQLIWVQSDVGIVQLGNFLTNFINGFTNSLIGHFLFIGLSILLPADKMPPIKMGFLFRYFFTGLFFFATLSVTFVYIGFFQKEQRSELNDYLTQRSQVVTNQLDEFLSARIKALTLTARAIEDSSGTTQKRLMDIAENFPRFLTFLVTDKNGIITHSQPQELFAKVTESGHLDVSYRSYFSVPYSTGQEYLSPAFEGKGFGNDPIAAISSPLYDEQNNFMGIVEGSLALSSFANYDQNEINEQVHILIADHQGTVIYASDALQVNALDKMDNLICLDKNCVLNDKQQRTQEQWIMSRYVSPKYSWSVIKFFPKSEFSLQVSRYIAIAIVLLLLLAILANLASFLVASVFSRPLTALIRNFAKFDPANPTFEGIEHKSKQYLVEIAALDNGFDELRFRLVQLFSQLNLANTNQENLNDELRELNDSLGRRVSEKTASLEVALERANLASEAKSRFLANMSHEIRTPMNGILGSCQNLQEVDLDEQSRRKLNIIQQSAKALMDILNGILDWSKIESGKMSLENNTFSLSELLDNCVELHQHHAQEKGLTLETSNSDSLPEYVVGDSTKLNQIINNLINNAIKFTEKGFVKLTASYAQGTLYLQVQDTGVGIEEEQKRKVFDEFAQADASTTRLFGGTGLGLAISLGLANIMGGNLTLESEQGVGTTVKLRLPIKATENAKITIQESQARLPENLRILLAEDNDINAEIILDMLKAEGRRVIRVGNGKVAVEAVSQHEFDLVLMDCQMPVMDGFEATRAIRSLSSEKANVPIIALTANAYAEDRQRCLDAGMNDHIAKPVEKDKLFNTVLTNIGAIGFVEKA